MSKSYLFTVVVSTLLVAGCIDSPPIADSGTALPDTATNLSDLPSGDAAIAGNPNVGTIEPDELPEEVAESPVGPSDTHEEAGDGIVGLGNDLAAQPLTPGIWQSARGGIHFGEAQSEPRFSMVCDRQTSTIVLYRAGLIGSSEQLQLFLYTETASATSHWQFESDVLPQMVARLPMADPIWPEVAVADRFGVAVESRPSLILPVSDLVREFVTVCGTED
ncbi:MAG: hypothetical protein AAFY26_25835 [Cyanobacteria bacterium J06638_22]